MFEDIFKPMTPEEFINVMPAKYKPLGKYIYESGWNVVHRKEMDLGVVENVSCRLPISLQGFDNYLKVKNQIEKDWELKNKLTYPPDNARFKCVNFILENVTYSLRYDRIDNEIWFDLGFKKENFTNITEERMRIDG